MFRGFCSGYSARNSSRSFSSSAAVNGTPDCFIERYFAKNSRERRSVSLQSPPPGTVFFSIVSESNLSSGAGFVGSLPSFTSSPSLVPSPSEKSEEHTSELQSQFHLVC